MHLAVEPTATAYVLFILHKIRNVYRLHPVFICERRVEDMFRPTQSSMASCLARLRCCGSRWHGSGTQEPCGCQCQQASRMDPGLLLVAAAAAAPPRSALRSDPAQKKSGNSRMRIASVRRSQTCFLYGRHADVCVCSYAYMSMRGPPKTRYVYM